MYVKKLFLKNNKLKELQPADYLSNLQDLELNYNNFLIVILLYDY